VVARLALVATALAVSAAGAACGGDGGGGGEALTHEEFVARATEICSANDHRVVTIAQRLSGDAGVAFEPTAEQVAGFVASTIPEFRRMFDELADLRPPEPDRQAFRDLLDEGRSALRRVDKMADSLALPLTGELGEAFAPFNRAAVALGLTACGENEEGGGTP
jgi:hypothetical protein